MKIRLDEFEKEIEENIDFYRPVSCEKQKKIESILEKARKAKNINIRINSFDLEKIRARSLQEGLLYQTLISSILHKYVTNQLVDQRSVLNAIKLLG